MIHYRRNNALAGIFMLVGCMLIGVGSGQPWVHIGIPWLHFDADFGFDQTVMSDGTTFDFKKLIIAIAVITSICAVALIATRVRGLGVLWRIIALACLAVLGGAMAFVWPVANDPAVLAHNIHNSAARTALIGGATLLKDFGAVSVGPSAGLWTVTVGVAIGVIGALIPGAHRDQWVPIYGPMPPGPPPPGSYPAYPPGPVLGPYPTQPPPYWGPPR